jgi:hypothetical protein
MTSDLSTPTIRVGVFYDGGVRHEASHIRAEVKDLRHHYVAAW